jgi:hypothetical protein
MSTRKWMLVLIAGAMMFTTMAAQAQWVMVAKAVSG